MKDALLATSALEKLGRTLNIAGLRRDSLPLQVEVFQPGAVGGTPTVGIEDLHRGIDWDASKLLLRPLKPLTTLSPDDVEAIRQSVRKGQSWHAYKAWEKQQARIKELEAELAQLKGLQ